MIRFTLFGTARLEGSGPHVSGRIVQRRQLALLSALALAPGRKLSRDRLLALFWPESDAERARHNLADSVYVVRKELGDEAVAGVGDDLFLNPDCIATDVDDFLGALSRGDDEAAVAAYCGPLLDGFHLGQAGEFDRWLDGERDRLSRAYCAALERLANAAARPADAVEWWRRLAAVEPLNTRVTLALMRALAAAGDRAAAIRHAHVHAALLESELEAAPDPEVAALAASLRDAPSRDDAATPQARTSPEPMVFARAPALPQADPARRPPRRRTAAVAATIVAIAAIVALGVRGGASDLVADRVVVLPFQASASERDTETGEWIAYAITSSLVQAEIGDPVLPPDMIATNRSGVWTGPDRIDRAADEFRAGIVVSGMLHRTGGVLEITSVITDAATRRPISALGPVRVVADSVPAAVDALRARVIGALASHLSRSAAAHPYVMQTPTIESYRAADHANALFLDRNFDEAAATFRRAYELDSTATAFLLWSAISHSNNSNGAAVDSILEELRPHRDRLSRFDAAQYAWLTALRAGDQPARLRAAEIAHAEAPHSGLGGYQLGTELLRSDRPADANDVFRALNPEHGWLSEYAPYWRRFAFANHLLGRHDAELRIIERMPAHHRARNRDLELHALAALGHDTDVARLIPSVDDYQLVYGVAKESHAHGAAPEIVAAIASHGLDIIRALPAPESPAAQRVRDVYSARFLAHIGDLPAARALLDALVRAVPGNALYVCWLGIVQARMGDRTAALAAVRRLEELAAGRETGLNLARQAAILAEIGEDVPAVAALLGRARAMGYSVSELHAETPFVRVRDHPDIRQYFEFQR